MIGSRNHRKRLTIERCAFLFSTPNVEEIDNFKGVQCTDFGRATAAVINIVTHVVSHLLLKASFSMTT